MNQRDASSREIHTNAEPLTCEVMWVATSCSGSTRTRIEWTRELGMEHGPHQDDGVRELDWSGCPESVQ